MLIVVMTSLLAHMNTAAKWRVTVIEPIPSVQTHEDDCRWTTGQRLAIDTGMSTRTTRSESTCSPELDKVDRAALQPPEAWWESTGGSVAEAV